MKYKALLFDLDGVLVDTAKYHYLAWKQIADELGVPFDEEANEAFKGVSRSDCMDMLVDMGGLEMDADEKAAYCDSKNDLFTDFIMRMDADEILPGVREFIEDAKAEGYLIGLGSASKNAPTILAQVGLTGLFDAIVDGTMVSKAKPDPEVFAVGAELLGTPPEQTIVFEDAVAGVDAAHRAGMKAVGISPRPQLGDAELTIPTFAGHTIDEIVSEL